MCSIWRCVLARIQYRTTWIVRVITASQPLYLTRLFHNLWSPKQIWVKHCYLSWYSLCVLYMYVIRNTIETWLVALCCIACCMRLFEQIFRSLQTLAITSAGLFFILSRDRDPNVFDAESLPVMLKLLGAPDSKFFLVSSEYWSFIHPTYLFIIKSVCFPVLHAAMASTTNGHQSCLSRTNKEAERVRTRVRQLLDGLQHHQSSTRKSSVNNGASGLTSSSSPSDANSFLLGVIKRPVSRIPSTTSSSVSTLAPSARPTGSVSGLNTRHLQMTRQLTVTSFLLIFITGCLVRVYFTFTDGLGVIFCS